MVIEKASGRTVQENFEDRLFGPRYGLTNTAYRAGIYPREITDRMASGYFVAEGYPGMKALDGADVKGEDMSWGGAAGAAVSRPEEVNNWVRALFASNDLLDADARAELTRVVSMRTGATLARLTPDDPAASASASRDLPRPRSAPAGSTRANRWASAPSTSTCPRRISSLQSR